MLENYIILIEKYLKKNIWQYSYIDSWWDYNVVITENMVFRFPKNKDLHNNFLEEKKKLDLIKSYITIKIPEYIYIDQNMIVYNQIQWKIMKEFTLDTLDSIVNFLRELHSIPKEKFIKEEKKTDNNWLINFVSYMKEKIEKRLSQKDIDKKTITNIHKYMDELFFSFESPNQSFTHWDLQPKNIIISDSWEIEWIIDFSDSRVWSCELDFCHILHQSESLCKKAIEIYLWKYDQWFFERIFFLSRRSVIFEIDNDDMYHNNFDKIYQSLINSNFLFS